MPTTIPMIGPDGSVADIPQEQVGNAKTGGYKLAVDMTAPDGNVATIPYERVGDAMSQGGYKLPGAEQPKPGLLRGYYDMAMKPIKNLATQAYTDATNTISGVMDSQTPQEKLDAQNQEAASEQHKSDVYHSASAQFHKAMASKDVGGVLDSGWELRKLFEKGEGENPNDPLLTMTDAALRGAQSEYDKAGQHVTNVVNSLREAADRHAYGDQDGAQKALANVVPEASQAAGHGLAAALPLVGPAAASVGEELPTNPAHAIGGALGLLSPSILKGVKEAGLIGKVGGVIGKAADVVKDTPVGDALDAAGIQKPFSSVGDAVDAVKEPVASMYDRATQKVGDLLGQTKTAAQGAADSVGDTAAAAARKVGSVTAEGAWNFGAGVLDTVSSKIQDAGQKFVDSMKAAATSDDPAAAGIQSHVELRNQVTSALQDAGIPPEAVNEIVDKVSDEYIKSHSVSGGVDGNLPEGGIPDTLRKAGYTDDQIRTMSAPELREALRQAAEKDTSIWGRLKQSANDVLGKSDPTTNPASITESSDRTIYETLRQKFSLEEIHKMSDDELSNNISAAKNEIAARQRAIKRGAATPPPTSPKIDEAWQSPTQTYSPTPEENAFFEKLARAKVAAAQAKPSYMSKVRALANDVIENAQRKGLSATTQGGAWTGGGIGGLLAGPLGVAKGAAIGAAAGATTIMADALASVSKGDLIKTLVERGMLPATAEEAVSAFYNKVTNDKVRNIVQSTTNKAAKFAADAVGNNPRDTAVAKAAAIDPSLAKVATPAQMGYSSPIVEDLLRKTAGGVGEYIAKRYDQPALDASVASANKAIADISPDTAGLDQTQRGTNVKAALPTQAPFGIDASTPEAAAKTTANMLGFENYVNTVGRVAQSPTEYVFNTLDSMSPQRFNEVMSNLGPEQAASLRQGLVQHLLDKSLDPDTGMPNFKAMQKAVQQAGPLKLGPEFAKMKTLSDGWAQLADSRHLTNTKAISLLAKTGAVLTAGVLDVMVAGADPVRLALLAGGEYLGYKFAGPAIARFFMDPKNVGDLNVIMRVVNNLPASQVETLTKKAMGFEARLKKSLLDYGVSVANRVKNKIGDEWTYRTNRPPDVSGGSQSASEPSANLNSASEASARLQDPKIQAQAMLGNLLQELKSSPALRSGAGGAMQESPVLSAVDRAKRNIPQDEEATMRSQPAQQQQKIYSKADLAKPKLTPTEQSDALANNYMNRYGRSNPGSQGNTVRAVVQDTGGSAEDTSALADDYASRYEKATKQPYTPGFREAAPSTGGDVSEIANSFLKKLAHNPKPTHVYDPKTKTAVAIHGRR
jgi:hypothetical protein